MYEDNQVLKSDLVLHKQLVQDKVDLTQKQHKQIKEVKPETGCVSVWTVP